MAADEDSSDDGDDGGDEKIGIEALDATNPIAISDGEGFEVSAKGQE